VRSAHATPPAYDWRVSAREARAVGTSRIVGLHDDHGEFDREFWAAVPPSRRLEMVWEMVLESAAWREPDDGQARLRRSVCRRVTLAEKRTETLSRRRPGGAASRR
jgi:hypothetical protein